MTIAQDIPASWACIDCGVNTGPGLLNKAQTASRLAASAIMPNGLAQSVDNWSEVYAVVDQVWRAARMQVNGGCLCIGCLEKRLGRILTPADFEPKHPFNSFPGTKRLLERRARPAAAGDVLRIRA